MYKLFLTVLIALCCTAKAEEIKNVEDGRTQELAQLLVSRIGHFYSQSALAVNAGITILSEEQANAIIRAQMAKAAVEISEALKREFNDQEIDFLTGYFQSETVKKLYEVPEVTMSILAVLSELISKISADSSPAEHEVHILTEQNYQKEIKEYEGCVLLEIGSNGCPPCKILEPLFGELSNEFSGQIKFLKMNCAEEQALVKEFKVLALPTILFFKKGKVRASHAGLIKKDDLIAKIEENFLN